MRSNPYRPARVRRAIYRATALLVGVLLVFSFGCGSIDNDGHNRSNDTTGPEPAVAGEPSEQKHGTAIAAPGLPGNGDAQTLGTTAATAAIATTVASAAPASPVSVTWELVNQWSDGKAHFGQYTILLQNDGKQSEENWSARIPVPEDAALEQFWNGEFLLLEGEVEIRPVSHNNRIEAGGSAEAGFIVKSARPLNHPVSSGGTSATPKPASTPTPAASAKPSAPSRYSDGPKISATSTTRAVGDWLSTDGNRIVDRNGNTVRLTGLNWFGYNTGTNAFDGLWSAGMEKSLAQIANRGFNVIRLPISTELLLKWKKGEYPAPNINLHENPELKNKNSLEVFDAMLGMANRHGLKIVIDNHSADTDPMGHLAPLWTSEQISEKDMLDALAWVAKRYRSNDTIIGIDLKNEPHGRPSEKGAIWNNSKDSRNWKRAAELAAKRVLEQNPNLLLFVEGIEAYPKDIRRNGSYASMNDGDYHYNWWGGNLRGVKDYPLDLGKDEWQAQIVYSPHDYGPTVYMQPWFTKNYSYESLKRDVWNDNWLFIHIDEIAPLLIGEWGGFMEEPNLKWMRLMRKLIVEHGLSHTFWCYNANSGDTGGLVLDDFKTWDEEKYQFVRPTLWQHDGRFVGLSQTVPLGSKGVSLGDVFR